MSMKLVSFWILGGLFLLGGIWIIDKLELNVGVSDFSYYLALLLALAFILIAGLCWISVAVATRKKL